ncbi:hypothetical protein CEXT_793851 [Caerostris extrusa]|uniref:Uncharacterized protein n=1 Tax=Caerostris extrusa TaxID=172846 RepID=A0AAV4QGS2_CAEEX|nr:hypothetical protein CEXT_793851 [Caerostris extrusa]
MVVEDVLEGLVFVGLQIGVQERAGHLHVPHYELLSVSIADGTEVVVVSDASCLAGHWSATEWISVATCVTFAVLDHELGSVPFLHAAVHHQGLPLADEVLGTLGGVRLEVLGVGAAVVVDGAGAVAVARPRSHDSFAVALVSAKGIFRRNCFPQYQESTK